MHKSIKRALIAVLLFSSCNHRQDSVHPLRGVLTDLGLSISMEKVHGHTAFAMRPFKDSRRNHFEPRQKKVRFLIMHYTAGNAESTVKIFTRPDTVVSSHYVITEKEPANGIKGGKLIRIVPEKDVAYHAGISFWQGHEKLNHTSIGIENVNRSSLDNGENGPWDPKAGRAFVSFDRDQIKVLGTLAQAIVKKYGITPDCVIGHSDIAFHRENGSDKIDPGPLFPWKHLYEQYGVGAWLTPQEQLGYEKQMMKDPLYKRNKARFFLQHLQEYGYKVHLSYSLDHVQNKKALMAFRIHYSQNGNIYFDQDPLSDNDCAWIYGLVKKYKS